MIISGLVLVLAVVRTYLLVIALPNVAYFMCNNITYRIVESKNPGFKEGDCVVANFGTYNLKWRKCIHVGSKYVHQPEIVHHFGCIGNARVLISMSYLHYSVYYHHYHVCI